MDSQRSEGRLVVQIISRIQLGCDAQWRGMRNLANTMKFSAQSTAVHELLISRKIATRQDLEAAMNSNSEEERPLLAKLDERIKKQH
jgi:hypothetical protein